MPIFDQGYQHWKGQLGGLTWRWLVITRHGIRVQAQNRIVRLLLLMALVPALTLLAFLVLWGLFENKNPLADFVSPLARSLLPMDGLLEPVKYRGPVWTLAFNVFLQVQTFVWVLLVLAVGPGLISQDLRFNAFPLYLSRPLRRFDYFLGKLGVIAVCIGGVTLVPLTIAYVSGVVFSLSFSIIGDTIGLYLSAMVYGLVVIASAGMLMLSISSLSRNTRYVGGMWIGFWIITSSISNILVEEVREPWCYLISYGKNLQTIGDALLGVDAAKDKMYNALPMNASGGELGMGPNRNGPNAKFSFGDRPSRKNRNASAEGPGSNNPAASPSAPQTPPPLPPGPGPRGFRSPVEPLGWRYSALVLGGLAFLSMAILHFRVRSLDRLK